MGETSELETKKVKRGWLKLVIATVLRGVFFMAQIIITLVVAATVEADPFVQTGIAEVCVAALFALAVVPLGGRKWLTVDGAGIRYALRVAWQLLIVGFVATAYTVYGAVTCMEHIPAGALARLVGMALLCLGIGVLEECLCRGILFGGLLGVAGGTRMGVMFAVAASSIWFGVRLRAHGHRRLLHGRDGCTGDSQDRRERHVRHRNVRHRAAREVSWCRSTLPRLQRPALHGGIRGDRGKRATSSYTTNVSPEAVTYALIVAVYHIPTIRSLMRIWKERRYFRGRS